MLTKHVIPKPGPNLEADEHLFRLLHLLKQAAQLVWKLYQLR